LRGRYERMDQESGDSMLKLTGHIVVSEHES
jgi:hypothetical protein